MKTAFVLLAEFVYFLLGTITGLIGMTGVWILVSGAKERSGGLVAVVFLALVISYRFLKAAMMSRRIRKGGLNPMGPAYDRYGSSPDGTSAIVPGSGGAKAAETMDGSATGQQHAQAWNRGTSRHPVVAWIRGIPRESAAILLVAGLILAVAWGMYFNRAKKHYVTVFIYGAKENVFIDGVPVTKMVKYDPHPPFADGFSVTERKPGYEITIRNRDQVIHSKKVGIGAYVINATTDSLVAVEPLVYKSSERLMYESINPYGSKFPRELLIKPSALGVYQMSDKPEYYRPVDFESDPPSSLPSKSSGEIDNIVKLHAAKIEEGAR